mmetsp:Transcript_27858/g.70662  ORF Transcript_27858/g.70662 Transcript_27858/m.70662 type:complete len:273 (+) Transcript_27858:278-1096(+)
MPSNGSGCSSRAATRSAPCSRVRPRSEPACSAVIRWRPSMAGCLLSTRTAASRARRHVKLWAPCSLRLPLSSSRCASVSTTRRPTAAPDCSKPRLSPEPAASRVATSTSLSSAGGWAATTRRRAQPCRRPRGSRRSARPRAMHSSRARASASSATASARATCPPSCARGCAARAGAPSSTSSAPSSRASRRETRTRARWHGSCASCSSSCARRRRRCCARMWARMSSPRCSSRWWSPRGRSMAGRCVPRCRASTVTRCCSSPTSPPRSTGGR